VGPVHGPPPRGLPACLLGGKPARRGPGRWALGVATSKSCYIAHSLGRLSSGLTAKAAAIHPVPSRTRKLSPPTFPAVVQCASLREACLPLRKAWADDLGTLAVHPCGGRRTVPF